MRGINLKVGDTVQIVSDCKSHGKIGTILQIDYNEFYPTWSKVVVKFSDSHWANFGYKSLKKIEEGEIEMSAVTGDYRIAAVKFEKGNNPDYTYKFALFDENVSVGDYVLCDSSTGWGVAKVADIFPKYDDNVHQNPKSEIICKVDFSAYNERKQTRLKKAELKKKLDAAASENKDLALYKAIAESNPAVKKLLEEYIELLGENV